MEFFEIIQAHPLLVDKFNTNPPPNQLELLHRISQTAKSSHCAKMKRGPQNFLIETKSGPNFEEKNRDSKMTLMSPHRCSTVLVKACWYCWYFGRKPKILIKTRDLQQIFQGWVTAHMTLKSWQHVWKYFRKHPFLLFLLKSMHLGGRYWQVLCISSVGAHNDMYGCPFTYYCRDVPCVRLLHLRLIFLSLKVTFEYLFRR